MSSEARYSAVPKALQYEDQDFEVCIAKPSKHRGKKTSLDDTNKDEKAEDEKAKSEKPPMVSYGDLFRFADRLDVLLMILGTFGALGQGAMLPIQFVIFGQLSDSFIEYTQCLNPASNCSSLPNIEEEMIPFSYYYIGIALGVALIVALQMVCWGLAAERQVHKIRKAFFKSILRQEMAWFDTNDSGELNSRLAEV